MDNNQAGSAVEEGGLVLTWACANTTFLWPGPSRRGLLTPLRLTGATERVTLCANIGASSSVCRSAPSTVSLCDTHI